MRPRSQTLIWLAVAVGVAGTLVTGLLLPWVSGAGLLARKSVPRSAELPADLSGDLRGNSRVLAADGSVITTFDATDRVPVTTEQIAPVMKQTMVAIEDARFYEHSGLDMRGTARALSSNVAAGVVRQGGATLSQRLVKQALA